MPTQGLWNIGGFNLPDFGISEALGIGPNNSNQMGPYIGPSNPSGTQALANGGRIDTKTGAGIPLGPTYYGPQTPAPSQQFSSFPTPQNNPQPSGPSQSDLLNSAYNDYFASLDSQLGGLGDQRSAQEQIANNTYNQGLNTATSQFDQSQNLLESNRKRTLNDLSDNLMASFKQGNQILGARGASDSSAANQYSYALAKQGNRARGDVQSQYDQNLFNLKNTYNTETKNLELQKNSQLQQIAQWFSEAQNRLRDLKGQAGLQKSQQALSIAMQAAQQVQQEAANKRALLDQWATNHATSFQQLAQQLGQTGQFQVGAPTAFGSIGGGNQANIGAFTGYGSTEDKTRGLFG